ncbi:transposase [Streptomyces mirabilis]
MGGDRATRLQRQLPASSHLLSHQAPFGRSGHRTPAGTQHRRRLDPPPPRLPLRRRTAPAQGRAGPLPRTGSPGHVRSFAQILTERQGQRLPEWLDAVHQDNLPGLHTLAAGIDRDRDAVIAGLTLPWNSGVVEGHVNRIKMLKRQMFGRAGFALLRKRVLLAP